MTHPNAHTTKTLDNQGLGSSLEYQRVAFLRSFKIKSWLIQGRLVLRSVIIFLYIYTHCVCIYKKIIINISKVVYYTTFEIFIQRKSKQKGNTQASDMSLDSRPPAMNSTHWERCIGRLLFHTQEYLSDTMAINTLTLFLRKL